MPEHFKNEIPELKWSHIFIFMQDATWALFFHRLLQQNPIDFLYIKHLAVATDFFPLIPIIQISI